MEAKTTTTFLVRARVVISYIVKTNDSEKAREAGKSHATNFIVDANSAFKDKALLELDYVTVDEIPGMPAVMEK